ncbi:alpha/beta hydrolase family protein [Streptomyces sp. NBC_01803]|uniref:alpha/beta hydrolase family protein n=1 Tax=Streptomyces sp. NBC_01803 TaxID=2975946 RepID=UPI002DDAE504|nr:alpha/beta hydrolase [Streptomyces sp. NBC_01803]WSA46991.1 alpha/beta hydrolase [Streptomyces sp. NBC_01803]
MRPRPTPRTTRVQRTRLKLALTSVVAGGLALGAVGVADVTATATPAAGSGTQAAAEQEYRRGPNPTAQSVEAATGPFAIQQTSVPAGNGFGGGTIYYPTDTSQGTFGAIAISPGWTENQSSISWLGPKLASNGFVVFTIDNNNALLDFPDARGQQLLAALDYLTTSSAVVNRIDKTRLAVAGHSMGGGGSLRAAAARPEIQAAIPLTPWDPSQDWFSVRVPTLIVGGENDFVAPVNSHSEPFYESLRNAPERAYLEMESGSHFVTNSANPTIGRYVLSWLKRYVDNDTRYEQFLCPPPASSSIISEYRSSCPGS